MVLQIATIQPPTAYKQKVNGSGRKPTFLGKNEEQIQHEISYHHQYGLLKYETAAFLYL